MSTAVWDSISDGWTSDEVGKVGRRRSGHPEINDGMMCCGGRIRKVKFDLTIQVGTSQCYTSAQSTRKASSRAGGGCQIDTVRDTKIRVSNWSIQISKFVLQIGKTEF